MVTHLAIKGVSPFCVGIYQVGDTVKTKQDCFGKVTPTAPGVQVLPVGVKPELDPRPKILGF
jgi:hypothetical protein